MFAIILFSRITFKDLFATLKIETRTWLSFTVNDGVILTFWETFIFTKLRIRENFEKKHPREISECTVILKATVF